MKHPLKKIKHPVMQLYAIYAVLGSYVNLISISRMTKIRAPSILNRMTKNGAPPPPWILYSPYTLLVKTLLELIKMHTFAHKYYNEIFD